MPSVLAAAWWGGKPASAGWPGLAGGRAPLCFIESDGTPSWQRGAGGDILLLSGGDTLQQNQIKILTVKAWSISVRPSIYFINLYFVVRIPSPAPPPPRRLTPPPRPPAAAAAPPAAAPRHQGDTKTGVRVSADWRPATSQHRVTLDTGLGHAMVLYCHCEGRVVYIFPPPFLPWKCAAGSRKPFRKMISKTFIITLRLREMSFSHKCYILNLNT